MTGVSLSQEEKVNILVKIAGPMGLSADDILALYLVLGDGLFFVLDCLQGKTVSFPSLRVLRSAISGVGGYHVMRLNKSHYAINGVVDFSSKIKKNDEFVAAGDEFVALGSPQKILGQTYVLCKLKE
jgi:hypothetical protein